MIHVSETRAARLEEAEAVLETLCAAFGLNVDAARPIFYADPYYELSHKRIRILPDGSPPAPILGGQRGANPPNPAPQNWGGGASDGFIVSCLTVVPATLRVGGVPVPAGGIAGVATRPDFQSRGHAAALLEATVPALWDEMGYPLSLLHPISAPFYRRFGWEFASRAAQWAALPGSLPRHAEAAQVRPAFLWDWPAIQRLHAELTQADTGACVRDARRWALIQMEVPGRETYVTEDAGEVTGYVIFERQENLNLLEMYGRTPAARRGLAGFLASLPDPLLEWQTSPDFLRLFDLPLPEAPPEPGVMLRIVNLEAALAAVHAALYAPVLAGATLTLQITDPLCAQNERPLRLTPGGVIFGTTRDASWLRADIGTLARLYLGDLMPSAARVAGVLSVDSPRTLTLTDRLFPLRHPYIAPLDQS